MLSSGSDLYVQVWRSRLLVENLRTGERSAVEEGFGHPRLLIGDYRLAEHAIKRALGRVLGVQEWPHRVLVHVQEELDGGVSEVEVRALRELGLHAGAHEVWLYRKPKKLSRDEVEGLLRGTAAPALLAERTY